MDDNIKSMVDRFAMAAGGGLILISTVLIGLFEILAGNSVPMYVGKGGKTALSAGALETVTSAPVIEPNLRAGVLVLGLIILGLYPIFLIVHGAINGVPGFDVDSTAETFD